MKIRRHLLTAAMLAGAITLPASAVAVELKFRSFSSSAAIGPPAEAFAAKLHDVTRVALGAGNEIRFSKLEGTPPIPAQFGGSIIAAVAAGEKGGGFDAAYNSGSELNRVWGFIYNSGVPFGPRFDEFLGFLYGKSVDGERSGLDLLQATLDSRKAGVVAIPIVGSAEQLSGYFPMPIGEAPGAKGIGLAGLCAQSWTLRYLPPGENVLGQACDDLVARGEIPAKKIKFIAAVPGGGSLVDAVKAGQLHGFEFATPLDDVSQLFKTSDNPGTVGARWVHFPGWQQQFLVTWMVVNKQVWDSFSAAQKTLVHSVARDHVLASYAENLRQQGAALKHILEVNARDRDPNNDLVLVEWPKRDQERLRDATVRFLDARARDAALPQADRDDFVTILEAFRKYVRANELYFDRRDPDARVRFETRVGAAGEPGGATRP